MTGTGHYRWNVNPTWENFTGLIREAAAAREATNDVHRHHHVRAALYFAIASIEAFLNERMRKHMEKQGRPEQDIISKLRKGKWADKARDWPYELCGRPVPMPASLLDSLIESNVLRGEITHPKARDHSTYLELDGVAAAPETLPHAVAEYIVRLLEGLDQTYPYWLHGCAFIGMNGDPKWPILFNNQQFLHALRNLGLDVPAFLVDAADAWERQHMVSWDDFKQLDGILRTLGCQRPNPRFPVMPKLCRRWWDERHVEECWRGPPSGDVGASPPARSGWFARLLRSLFRTNGE